jgi:hypothetical protein
MGYAVKPNGSWRAVTPEMALTHDETYSETPPEPTAEQIAAELKIQTTLSSSLAAAAAIPGWATWTKSQAEAWYTENIVTPLAADLPATVSAATNRQVLIALIAVMRDMGVMLWAVAQMVIALRNRQWPGLQE